MCSCRVKSAIISYYNMNRMKRISIRASKQRDRVACHSGNRKIRVRMVRRRIIWLQTQKSVRVAMMSCIMLTRQCTDPTAYWRQPINTMMTSRIEPCFGSKISSTKMRMPTCIARRSGQDCATRLNLKRIRTRTLASRARDPMPVLQSTAISTHAS